MLEWDKPDKTSDEWWRAVDEYKIFNVKKRRGRPDRGGKEEYWNVDIGADVPSMRAIEMGVPPDKATQLDIYKSAQFDTLYEAKEWCETQR